LWRNFEEFPISVRGEVEGDGSGQRAHIANCRYFGSELFPPKVAWWSKLGRTKRLLQQEEGEYSLNEIEPTHGRTAILQWLKRGPVKL
jgi:hypothetical protein